MLRITIKNNIIMIYDNDDKIIVFTPIINIQDEGKIRLANRHSARVKTMNLVIYVLLCKLSNMLGP